MVYKGHIHTLVDVICLYNTDIFIRIFYYDSQNGWEPNVSCYDVYAKLSPVIPTDADYVVTLVTSDLASIQTVIVLYQVNGMAWKKCYT